MAGSWSRYDVHVAASHARLIRPGAAPQACSSFIHITSSILRFPSSSSKTLAGNDPSEAAIAVAEAYGGAALQLQGTPATSCCSAGPFADSMTATTDSGAKPPPPPPPPNANVTLAGTLVR